MTTVADIAAAWQRVMGTPLDGPTPPRPHPEQELADERAIDRAVDAAEDRAWATGRQMDGAAADWVYGREPALDWRRP